MDKKFWKKYRNTIIVIIVFIIIFLSVIKMIDFFIPNSGTPVYGNRLDGIVEISDEELEEIKNKIKEDETVTDVSTTISGKILNIKITVKDSASVSASKKIGNNALKNIKEEILTQYDIQVYLIKTSKEENNFPIIGYKKNTLESLTWTKDREKVEVEEKK